MTSLIAPKKQAAPPAAQPAVPVPTVDTARQNQQEQDQINRRRGRAATVLTGPNGDTAAPRTSASQVLGY